MSSEPAPAVYPDPPWRALFLLCRAAKAAEKLSVGLRQSLRAFAHLVAQAEDNVHIDNFIAFQRCHSGSKLHSLDGNVLDMTPSPIQLRLSRRACV
jgi:hypothetical protein